MTDAVEKALGPVTIEIKTRRIRYRVLRGLIKLSLLILFLIVVYRIVVPYLFDLHTDLGLVLAAAAGLFGLLVLIWFVFDVVTSLRRIRWP
jgi:uncharacterized integral membrane protein